MFLYIFLWIVIVSGGSGVQAAKQLGRTAAKGTPTFQKFVKDRSKPNGREVSNPAKSISLTMDPQLLKREKKNKINKI